MIQDLVTFKKLPNISIPNQVHSTPIASKRKQQEQKKEARGITQHVRQRLPAA